MFERERETAPRPVWPWCCLCAVTSLSVMQSLERRWAAMLTVVHPSRKTEDTLTHKHAHTQSHSCFLPCSHLNLHLKQNSCFLLNPLFFSPPASTLFTVRNLPEGNAVQIDSKWKPPLVYHLINLSGHLARLFPDLILTHTHADTHTLCWNQSRLVWNIQTETQQRGETPAPSTPQRWSLSETSAGVNCRDRKNWSYSN